MRILGITDSSIVNTKFGSKLVWQQVHVDGFSIEKSSCLLTWTVHQAVDSWFLSAPDQDMDDIYPVICYTVMLSPTGYPRASSRYIAQRLVSQASKSESFALHCMLTVLDFEFNLETLNLFSHRCMTVYNSDHLAKLASKGPKKVLKHSWMAKYDYLDWDLYIFFL